MVSIMPACVTVRRLLTSFFLVFVTVQSVQADAFHVENAHTSPAGNGYLLNAQISYPLNPRVKEALYNGVPITFVETKTHRNFPTMEGALQAMGEIEDFSLPPQHTLDTHDLILRLRSQIDLHALPSPMRPGAFLSNKWDLASEWREVAWPSN